VAEVQARDATTFGITVAVLMTVALVASWLPARRAAKTDPMETLRVE
jgi:ABC-type lipoprotein release transport system permease subunit